MLTADLAISWRRGARIYPFQVKTDDEAYTGAARDLITIFGAHVGQRRALLETALGDYVGTGTDYKILRGLIKLLTDRCEFETGVATDPALLRRTVFLAAKRFHPVTGEAAAAARELIAAEAAREHACAPEMVLQNLYADLPENQLLTSFDELDAGELLDRYNLAQAQALLYRSIEMRLNVRGESASSYRELFGAIKAYRLIHTITGNSADGYTIRLDGPVSIFHRSQKYGVQMAVFLPALLTCQGWSMSATIASKPAGNLRFELESGQTDLRTHYERVLAYENPARELLAAKWAKHTGEWRLGACAEVLDLGEGAFIPDYVLRHEDGRKVYLELLGFWTPEHLRERLRELEASGLKNFIIGAWDELRGSREPPARVPSNVILFKRTLDPAIVELTIEKLGL